MVEQGQTLSEELEALDHELAGSSDMAAAFAADLKKLNSEIGRSSEKVSNFERSLSNGLNRAIKGVVINGDSLTDALRRISDSMLSAAIDPVGKHLGSVLAQTMSGVMPFANGASFVQGRVIPFANGGVVNGAVSFPMRGGTGLMGEAGPEAIMPLSRGPDGKLGVRAQGNQSSVTVVMNISTPDAESFRKSQTQIASEMSRALSRGQRNR